MRKICKAAAFVLAFAALALTSARADALEFSAEFREKLGDEVREGKIYVTADKSRYEVEGADTIEITRADQKVMWVIFPKRRVYVEEEFWGFPLGTSLENSGERSGGGDLTREELGYETIDTFRLKKYLVTVKYNGGETEDKYYEWYRSDFPIPVKTQPAEALQKNHDRAADRARKAVGEKREEGEEEIKHRRQTPDL